MTRIPAGAEMTPQDEATIEALKRDDAEAIERVRRWVECTVKHRSWRSSIDDPENAAADIFLEVRSVLCAGRFQIHSKLQSYVAGIVNHQLRKYKTSKRLDAPQWQRQDAFNQQDMVEKDERLRLVQGVVQRLPEECAQIFEWVFDEELPYEEVGRRLGIRPGNARVRKLRCLERFRAAWKVVAARFHFRDVQPTGAQGSFPC